MREVQGTSWGGRGLLARGVDLSRAQLEFSLEQVCSPAVQLLRAINFDVSAGSFITLKYQRFSFFLPVFEVVSSAMEIMKPGFLWISFSWLGSLIIKDGGTKPTSSPPATVSPPSLITFHRQNGVIQVYILAKRKFEGIFLSFHPTANALKTE